LWFRVRKLKDFMQSNTLLFYPETHSFAMRESVEKPINSRLRLTFPGSAGTFIE